MAESLVDIGDDTEKNFILAKLVSLYGDTVDFDVINLLAQENEWDEKKCIEFLKVLGGYKNTDVGATPPTNYALKSSALDNQREVPNRTEINKISQLNEKFFTTVVSKSAKPKMAGNIQAGLPRGRQPSPSNTTGHISMETQEHHEIVKDLIKSGKPVLILLRGLPGSGKTTLAKSLLSTPGAKGSSHSTDEFFHVPRGGKGPTVYQYDPLRLGEAHEWNRVQVLRAIAHGVTPIIVDNTNVQKWEMLPYVEMALEPWEAEFKLKKMAASGSIPKNNICSCLGPSRFTMIGRKCPCGYIVAETSKVPYQVELLEPLTWWYRNPTRLAKVNQHGVTQKKITQMLSNFEFNISGKSLVNHIQKNKSNFSVNPQGKNTRPGIQLREQPMPSNVSGAPIYNMMPKPYQGNQFGARPRQIFPQNVSGNNAFIPPLGVMAPSPVRFPAVAPAQFMFPQHLLNFQQPISSPDPLSNRNQFNAANTNLIDKRKKEKSGKEDSSLYPLNRQSLFSKSASNISFIPGDSGGSRASSLEPKDRNECLHSGSLTTSESNICEKSLEMNSFVGSECVEMTEEELNEWMKNNSKWEWESSDEDSEDECKTEANEPKPERSLKLRHKDNSSEKDLSKESTSDVDTTERVYVMGEDTEIYEWFTEKIDPLTSWNPPEVTLEKTKDVDVVAPLPPRNSKRKRLAGNPPEPDDSPEEMEKTVSKLDQTQLVITQQIHSLLGEHEVRNKELDSLYQTCKNSANVVDANKKYSIHEYVNSVHVSIEGSTEHRNSDSSTSSGILSNDKVSSEIGLPLLDSSKAESSITLSNLAKSEVSASESEGLLIEIGTESSESSDAILNVVSENDKAILEEKIDDPLLAAFDVILPANPVDAIIDVNNAPTDSMAPKEDLNFSLKETSRENNEIDSSSSTNEQEITSQENLKFLASLIKEGFKWLDGGFHRKSKYGVTEDAEKKDKDNFSQVPTSETTVSDNVFESVPPPENFQDTKDLEELRSDELLSLKQQDKEVKLIEDTEKLEKHKDCEEKVNTPDVSLSEIIETESSRHTSIEVEISFPVQQDRKTEMSNELETMDNDHSKIIVGSQDYKKDSEDEQKKDVQFSSTSASCELLVSASNLLNESSDLRNTQKIIETNADLHTSDVAVLLNETSGEGGNLDKTLSEIVCDVNVVPPSISSSNEGTSSLISAANITAIGKLDASNLEEISEMNQEPVEEKEKAVSLLEILENLRKNKEKAANDSLSAPEQQVIEEENEKFNSEKGEKEVDSKENSCPIWTKADQGLGNILAQLKIDEERENFEIIGNTTKETVERKKFLSDWSVLNKREGDTLDLDHESETFPLVLDPSFIAQICQKFGNPYQDSMDESSKFNVGNKPSGVTVQIPADLAKKLHECWLKTQWNAILDEEEISQKIVLEDELLAHQLQALEEEDLKEKREHNDSSSSNTPNLREIMDMEMAMAIYKADQDRTTAPNQKNDLSTRLSWDMLTKEFPQIPQDVITEIFSAYNFSYENARDALLSSLPDYERDLHEQSVKDVVSPEILAAQEKALIEKAKLESLKSKEDHVEEEKTEIEEEGSWEALVDQARKAASLNRRLQKERHAQAQAASRSGIPSAAAYYCRMASLHKQKVDEANRKAANILSRVFTGEYNNLQGSSTGDREISRPPMTLDMHSMTVLEALRVLNAFIDAHAEWLRNNKSRTPVDLTRKNNQAKMITLFLITGRGVNSQGGIPRIKPAVEKLLEKRGVWYEELNPGLLRVMVSSSLPPSKKL